jgi:polar amino acid transport system substrate-binding protein
MGCPRGTFVLEQIDEARIPRLVLWPHLWASEPAYLTLHRKHADLVPRIDAALQQMKREGPVERFQEEGMRRLHLRPLTLEGSL